MDSAGVYYANAHIAHPRSPALNCYRYYDPSIAIPPRLPFHYRAGWPEEAIFRVRIAAARS